MAAEDQRPRKTIKELQTTLKVERTFRYLVVEGAQDSRQIRALSHPFSTSLQVIEVSKIEICADLLTKYNLTEGNRQRTIALCKEMEELVCPTRFRGFVDRDFESDSPAVTASNLFYTDYACMESYYLLENSLKKFFLKIADLTTIPGTYDEAIRATQTVFAARLYNHQNQLDLAFDCERMRKHCREGRFDESSWLEWLVSSNKCQSLRPEIQKFVEKALQQEKFLDPKMTINGHDFLEFIALLVKGSAEISQSEKDKWNSQSLQTNFLACLEREHITAHNAPVLDSIINWIKCQS